MARDAAATARAISLSSLVLVICSRDFSSSAEQ